MDYTFNQLRIFLKITQTGSVTKASKELNLTQPAVSIQLKKLQDQFDIPLTEIIGRKIHITDFGKEIASAAEKILNQVYDINYKTLAHKGQLTGRLKISVVSTGIYVLPFFLSDFLQEHPGVELKMDVTNKSKVIESLNLNEVDFSMVSVLPDNMKIEKTELLQNKLYVIGNSNYKIESTMYDETFFNSQQLIYRENGSGTRQTMEEFIQKNDLPVRKKMELTSNEAVKQAVIAGLGCSIMPLIGIKNELQNGELQIIPVKGFPIDSMWHLIWLKGKNHSPVAFSFLNHLKNEKENIAQNRFKWCDQYIKA